MRVFDVGGIDFGFAGVLGHLHLGGGTVGLVGLRCFRMHFHGRFEGDFVAAFDPHGRVRLGTGTFPVPGFHFDVVRGAGRAFARQRDEVAACPAVEVEFGLQDGRCFGQVVDFKPLVIITRGDPAWRARSRFASAAFFQRLFPGPADMALEETAFQGERVQRRFMRDRDAEQQRDRFEVQPRCGFTGFGFEVVHLAFGGHV